MGQGATDARHAMREPCVHMLVGGPVIIGARPSSDPQVRLTLRQHRAWPVRAATQAPTSMSHSNSHTVEAWPYTGHCSNGSRAPFFCHFAQAHGDTAELTIAAHPCTVARSRLKKKRLRCLLILPHPPSKQQPAVNYGEAALSLGQERTALRGVCDWCAAQDLLRKQAQSVPQERPRSHHVLSKP